MPDDGTVLAGPRTCNDVPNGASCVLSFPIGNPYGPWSALQPPTKAYCHVEATTGAAIVGGLRLVALSSFSSQTVAHAALEKLDRLGCPCWTDHSLASLASTLNGYGDPGDPNATDCGLSDTNVTVSQDFVQVRGIIVNDGNACIRQLPPDPFLQLEITEGQVQQCMDEVALLIPLVEWCD